MEHANIVTEDELGEFSDRRESEAIVPELVCRLVRASIPSPELVDCRIPYGSSVGQPGLDGFVETIRGFLSFVPKGQSYWEIGTGATPIDKATRDYKARTSQTTPELRANATFVFVTPRSAGSAGWTEPSQRRWKEKRLGGGWKDIRILDGHRLSEWLREFPTIGRWLAAKTGKISRESGITTPHEHWQYLQRIASEPDPSLTTGVFLCDREAACRAAKGFFDGEFPILQVRYHDPDDVFDFIAAYLESNSASLGNVQCVFVKDLQAWESLIQLRQQHFLVAHPKLDLESQLPLLVGAKSNKHSVVLPVQIVDDNAATTITLQSPTLTSLESTLEEGGFDRQRAFELASMGAMSLVRLKRHILNLNGPPDYTSGQNARVLAQAMLIGRWDGASQSDRDAIETLVGKSYGEWIESVQGEILSPAAPLIQRDDKYKFIARSEAWQYLGKRLLDSDLDLFREIAVNVLGERDSTLR